MALQTSTGVRYYISAALPATNDKLGYDALTWTEVGEVESLSTYGATQTEVNFTNLADGILKKFKGTTNYGSMTVGMGYDETDAGQLLLEAASGGAANLTVHSHKVVYPGGRVDAFQGYVFGYDKTPGSIDNVIMSSSTIGINTKPIDIQ